MYDKLKTALDELTEHLDRCREANNTAQEILERAKIDAQNASWVLADAEELHDKLTRFLSDTKSEVPL